MAHVKDIGKAIIVLGVAPIVIACVALAGILTILVDWLYGHDAHWR